MSKQERMQNLHLIMTFPMRSGHTSNSWTVVLGCLRTWQTVAAYFVPYVDESKYSFSYGIWFCLKFYCILILNSVCSSTCRANMAQSRKPCGRKDHCVFHITYQTFFSFRKGLFLIFVLSAQDEMHPALQLYLLLWLLILEFVCGVRNKEIKSTGHSQCFMKSLEYFMLIRPRAGAVWQRLKEI